ncbi:MAG: hypothetical protein AB7S38_28560 [Vulcanimicrobiota bacterium]
MRIWLLFLLLVAPGLADQQVLLTTTSDRDSERDVLRLELDSSGHPLALIQVRDKKETHFTQADLEQGAVLKHEAGRDVAILYADSFDPEKGGRFRLHYLVSGIPPVSYDDFYLHLKPDSDGSWHLYLPGRAKPLKRLHFVLNRVGALGYQKIIGIKTIRPTE